MTRIVIIGGGIAGLSAAYYASKIPGVQVILLESSDRWGGKIVTEHIPFADSEFIVEGGPDSFLATKPWGVALCQELGLSDQLITTNPNTKNTYVLNRNRLLSLPDGLTMMIPTNIRSIIKSPLVSWIAKARMGLDFILPPKPVHGDESLGVFISRRLGRDAYENLIEPLMSGIYAGDGDRLSLASTFPYLRDLELQYGSLARGARKVRQESNGRIVGGSRSAFLTPITGLAEIVEKLVAHLTAKDVVLRLKTKALRIIRTQLRYEVELVTGENLETDAVILATPAFISGALLNSLDPSLGDDLRSIPYVSTATISLAYRQDDIPYPLDGYGYVIPRREGRRALACTWTSTKFPQRAPQGYVLLRVFVGRAGQDIPWNENDLLALAREELKLTLGVNADPIFSRVFLWDQAMPQYNLGHLEILKRIDAALENYPGLALAGNSYRGVGIPDCIHSGELAVEKILLLRAEQKV